MGRNDTHLSPDTIYKNIARITERINDLNANHQTFYELHHAAVREIKLLPAHKQENNPTMKDLADKYEQINGDKNVKRENFENDRDYKQAMKGSYGFAKTLGHRLIHQYHNQMTSAYQNIT